MNSPAHAQLYALRLCGLCRKPGHRRETCARRQPEVSAQRKAERLQLIRERMLHR